MSKKIFLMLSILIFTSIFVSANADVNEDGMVDIDDLVAVAGDFGKTSGFNPLADTDTNGVIDIFDVVYVASRFGTVEPPPPTLNGNLVYADSLSPSDIQAAVDSASSGDTVILPEGDYSGFDSTVYVPNGISMKGQGVDRTILRRTANTGIMFRWNYNNPTPSSYKVEISDFKLVGFGYGITTHHSGIWLYNGMKDFIIHDLHFENFSSIGIDVTGDSRGVIYNSVFKNIVPDDLSYTGYGVSVIGDEAWDDPKPALGTQDMVFIEDNHFINCKHAVATSAGSNHVFRYNTVEGWAVSRHLVDAHGKLDPWLVGSNTWEVYKNTLKCTGRDDLTDWGITHRGGSGVIWGNTITGCDPKTGPGTQSKAIAFTIDEHETYPDPYQIKDTYLWDNTNDGQPLTEVYITAKALDYVKEDREYFLYQKPGYTPYTYPHPLRG